MTFAEWLHQDPDRVYLEALRQWTRIPPEPGMVVEARRQLLDSPAYAPCPHYRNGHY